MQKDDVKSLSHVTWRCKYHNANLKYKAVSFFQKNKINPLTSEKILL